MTLSHSSLFMFIGFLLIFISILFLHPIISIILCAIYFGWIIQIIPIDDNTKRNILINIGIIFVISSIIGWIIPYSLQFMYKYLIIVLLSIIISQLFVIFGIINDIKLIQYIIIGLFTIWIIVDSNIMKNSPNTWTDASNLALSFYLDIINLFNSMSN